MALDLSPLPIRPRRILLYLFCLGWFTLLCWWHRHVVMDDPWITFHYAANLLAGEGWVFNPGDPVEGFSNFTWVLVSMAALWARIHPLGAARLVSWVCAAILLALFCFGRREDGEGGTVRWPLPRSGGAAILLVACHPLAVWTMGGLETIAYSLLVFAALIALSWGSTGGGAMSGVLAGAALALVAMTRPEGAMYAGLLVPAFLLAGDRAGRQAAGLALAVFLVVFAIYTGWRVETFGSLVPNTVSAKVGGGVTSSLAGGLAYAAGFFLSAPALLLALGGLGIWRARGAAAEDVPPFDRCFSLLCAAAVVLQLAFTIGVGGDWMPAGRFLVPMLAPLCWLAARALDGWPVFVRVVLLCFFLPAGLIQAKRDPMLNWCRWAAKEQGGGLLVAPLVETGLWLRDNTPEDALVAASEAGVVPYYSRRRFLDMLGLVDRHIASMPGGLHQRTDPGYILGRRPDYIILQLVETPGGISAPWPSDASVYTSPGFAPAYEEVHRIARPMNDERWGMRPGWLVIHRRKDGGGAG